MDLLIIHFLHKFTYYCSWTTNVYKISSPWGDAFITDNSWSSIVGTNPPATPPLNAALIGHSDPSLITSYNDLVTFSSGGIGGLGLHIGVVPETSTYSLFLGLISIAFAIKRKKWGGRHGTRTRGPQYHKPML